MAIITSITILIILIYCMVIWQLSEGLLHLPVTPVPHPPLWLPVTVVVPFRDEEERLPDLVRDLSCQSYPENQFNVIFVNDHSVDGSKAKLVSLISNDARFNCLDLPAQKTGKKEAISWAIQHASSEWIIQTDADCRLGPQFIASHMAFKEKQNPDLVAGLVTIGKGKGGFLEAMERLDLLGLVGSGAGSFHFHRAVMCNGANLAYSRDLYMETRQFDPAGKVASGDDMFLMIGARKLKRKLSFHVSPEAMVETYPSRTLVEFLARRIRWGSKTVQYGIFDIQLLALLVVLVNLLVLLMPLFILMEHGYWPWLAAGLILKSIADFTMLYRVAGLTGQRYALWYFLPVSLVYYLIQMVVIPGALFIRTKWKGK